MTEQLKEYIDNIQTVEIMKALISEIPHTAYDYKHTQEISDYATCKLNHLLVK